MNQSPLESGLKKAAAGGSLELRAVLAQLAEHLLYAPALRVKSLKDERGTSKVVVATFKTEGQKVVTAFTSEDYFAAWAPEDYQYFAVVGADLAMTLPKDVWLLINAGQENSLLLSPEDVCELAASLKSTFQKQAPVSISKSAEKSRGSVTDSLTGLFEDYPEVLEAYYVDTESEYACGVLGILTAQLSSERRFFLIADIAEIAQHFFDMAGAIEVYDELSDPNSPSWDLFSAQAPFFVKEMTEDVEIPLSN